MMQTICTLLFYLLVVISRGDSKVSDARSDKGMNADTVYLSKFGVSSGNPDNAPMIGKGVQAAIDQGARVILFPSGGTYKVRSSNYWTIPDHADLKIISRGATVEVAPEAATSSQETYVMAFRCSDINSANSKLTVSGLNIRAPGIKPQWTNRNYPEHKLVIAIETDNVHTVEINNCRLNDITGYGIRLKNFVSADISGIRATNVGGHFPIENEYDSFGDAVWLGHYDVQTARPTRKSTYARIDNCVLKGYSAASNGNFASRSGITVEGFNSYREDIIVKLDVSNSTISDYDRNLHVEGISSNIRYSNCDIRNFFGIALIVKSTKTALAYDNCKASGQLAPNPKQERLALGGAMQFESYFDLTLTNNTVFSFSRPASFRANLYLEKNSVIDFGNADVFFDHTNLYMRSGGRMINIPAKVPRGYNMYGGRVELDGAIFSGKWPLPGVFHGENIAGVSLGNSKLRNTRLFFTGPFGTQEML